jgi:hypothetical protein
MSGFSSYICLHKEITTPPVYSNFPEWAIRDVGSYQKRARTSNKGSTALIPRL